MHRDLMAIVFGDARATYQKGASSVSPLSQYNASLKWDDDRPGWTTGHPNKGNAATGTQDHHYFTPQLVSLASEENAVASLVRGRDYGVNRFLGDINTRRLRGDRRLRTPQHHHGYNFSHTVYARNRAA